MSNKKVKFKILTQASYDELLEKKSIDATTLYFVEDEKKIYRGETLYTSENTEILIDEDSAPYLSNTNGKLSLKIGKFDLDEDGVLNDKDSTTGVKEGEDGLITASKVGEIVLDNELVTATALSNLDLRVDAIEEYLMTHDIGGSGGSGSSGEIYWLTELP